MPWQETDTMSLREEFVQKALQGQSDRYGDKYAGLVRMSERNYFCVSGPVFDDEDNLVACQVAQGAICTE